MYNEENYIVVDLETTGLYPAVEDIIEIGAIKVKPDSNKFEKFQCFVKPTKPIPDKVVEITKWETQEKKRTYKNKPKTIKKMVIGTYISIITLNVNGLNAPTKRHLINDCYPIYTKNSENSTVRKRKQAN